MRGIFLGAVALGLAVGLSVAGVRVFTSGSDAPEKDAPAQSGSPEATAEAFAGAWNQGDYSALYLLLTPDSQRAISLQEFTQAYESFESELTGTQLSASVQSAGEGQATLAVRLATAYFGDFEYTTVLNLSPAPGGWTVNWDTSTIHPDMAGGRTFKSSIERPVRGTIFDRNGEPLALTQDVSYIGLNRSIVVDRAGLTAALVGFGFTEEQVDAAFADPAGPTQRVRVSRVRRGTLTHPRG